MGLPPSLSTLTNKGETARAPRAPGLFAKFFGKFKFLSKSLRYILAFATAFLVSQINLDYIEAFFYDLRVKYRVAPEVSGDIIQVITDSKTVEQFRGVPGFDVHQLVLEKIKSKNPYAIVYVTDLTTIEGSDEQKKSFARTAAEFENLYQVTDELEMKGEQGKINLPAPLDTIKKASGPKTVDSKLFAKDGVTRRLFVSYQDQLMLHPILASHYNSEIKEASKIRGQIDVFDSKQIYIYFHPTGSFKTVRFEDIFNGTAADLNLENKIVLIGDDLGKSHNEYIYTPYLRTINTTTITEMHANMFETLIKNMSPLRTPKWFDFLMTLIISVLTVNVVLTLKPVRGIIILAGTAIGVWVLAYFSFFLFGLWISLAQIYLAIFLCYYFFIPYRLIIENRRSWEYYQKNRLLSQVEELKTNFISLMSHDLKTPIARIQGMTDIIAKDPMALSSNQREALDTIKVSSDDLLKFINSILNYARIESDGIELHWQNKDINELIKDVVKKNEFLAKLKHIQLITEFEPLFHVKLDPELIKQVFSNLIENAIKYSPENSKVLISTEEVDGKIIVQIADQGIGISSDELSNIFMKFFRSKEAKNSPIKGSGLGLYLAKYFVELHKGQIKVESSQGLGSTFTVELPVRN